MRSIPQPLGRNQGGYLGEVLDLETLLRDLDLTSQKQGWHRDFLEIESYNLLALRKPALAPKFNLYISAGMHGDEPAGPLAALELLKTIDWPETINVWLCPLLNSTGFQLNRRENASGIDLNRDYFETRTPEIASHKKWLEHQPQFDLALCLHEDWEARGFYIYELNPDKRPSFAPEILAAAAKICPIDESQEIDGWPASLGLIHPNRSPAERTDWPEALYLISHKTRHSYTLESPSDFPLETRICALVEAVKAVIQKISAI